MTPLFLSCVRVVIATEGGYTNDARDPGGVTKFGISQRAYPNLDIQGLAWDGAAAIYERDFWAPMHCDEMTGPMPLVAFDTAVNNGVPAATILMQHAAGVKADGRIGPVTLAAVAADPQAVAIEMVARRIVFMAKLATWPIYELGWSRRLAALPYHAMNLGTGV